MTQPYYGQGMGYGYPTWGYGPTFFPGGYALSTQMGRWPFFGPYGPGLVPHPLAYPAAPTPPMDDRDIRKLVTNYLSSDPRLSPESEITVDVSAGVVTVSGTVPDKWSKYFAGEDCFNVPAVVDVINNLRIVTERRKVRGRRERRGRTEQP